MSGAGLNGTPPPRPRRHRHLHWSHNFFCTSIETVSKWNFNVKLDFGGVQGPSAVDTSRGNAISIRLKALQMGRIKKVHLIKYSSVPILLRFEWKARKCTSESMAKDYNCFCTGVNENNMLRLAHILIRRHRYCRLATFKVQITSYSDLILRMGGGGHS